MIKLVLVSAILAAATEPAVAQSIFDGFGESVQQPPAATELQQWRREISKQAFDHTPNRSGLGQGRAIVNFCVDAAGRVVQENLGKYSGNAHALVAASVISSLKLPPAPPAIKSKLRGGCFWFQQSFWFN
jgi:hypothetical protein